MLVAVTVVIVVCNSCRNEPHLSATVQARHLSLFGHIVRMPDESDAKQILTASPLENWRRPPGCPCTTWMKTTQ